MTGLQRTARHLWRHCQLAMAVAALTWVKVAVFVAAAGITHGHLKLWFIDAGCALLLAAPLCLLQGRARGWAATALSLFVSAVVISELAHVRYFHDVGSAAALGALGQTWEIRDSIAALLHPADFLLALDVPALLWLTARSPRPGHAAGRGDDVRLRATAWALITLLAIPTLGIPLRKNMQSYSPRFFRDVWSRHLFVRANGLLFYHGHDLWRLAKQALGTAELTPTDRAAIQAQWRALDQRAADNPGAHRGVARGMNVIVLTVESLQDQVLGRRAGNGEVAPFLSKLAGDAARPTHFFHQAHQGRTADAELALLCGLHPLPVGAAFFLYPAMPQRCLPQILREEAGYHTATYHAAAPSMWNRSVVMPNVGFEQVTNGPDYAPGEQIGLGLADGPFLRQTADKIAQLRQPFFAQVLTLTSHHPYPIPQKHRQLQLGPTEDNLLGHYMRSIRYVDGAIEAFVKQLDASGLLHNSVLVIVGDHDMGLPQDDDSFELGFDAGAATTVERLRARFAVPMLLLLPPQLRARALPLRHVGAQTQLPATLLDLLGLPRNGRDFFAGSMLDKRQELLVMRGGAATDGTMAWEPAALSPTGKGQCTELSSGKLRNRRDCDMIAGPARERLRLSELVLRHGLHRPMAP